LIRSIATVHQGNSVFAGVGERTREGTELYRQMLESGVMKDTVMVFGQMNEPPGVRLRVALTALSMAEYFRDQGRDVLLLMDSLTRFALAQREIGLAAGEPPTTRGYPPSVFSLLPKLAERAGRSPRGSITAFYSVLVEGDDPNEPISDAVRGVLDGHVLLSRKIASRGQYPAIDVLPSISRLMPAVVVREQLEAATTIRDLMAAYRDHEDLISIGAYRRGANPRVDVAIALQEDIARYLRQDVRDGSSLEQARDALERLAARATSIMRNSAAPGNNG
jgi:FliI/YscN family ATPase